MNDGSTPLASEYEKKYVQTLSRKSTVSAYTNWMELSEIERQFLDQFLKEGDNVLDLGCGTGRIPKILGPRLGGYLGIDCSAEMIKAAKELNQGFEFKHEDFLESHFEKCSFDVVLLMNNVVDMLHPIERRLRAFELVKDLLSSTSVMICSSHLLNGHQVSGYYEEEYYGAMVNTYRSSFGQLCDEVESHGLNLKLAARDFRPQSQFADWVYLVASK